ncbi:uncharacterized protein LOC113510319 [Galleria mellonella]|uniref:Uncharacterized protein LOC113510319 n=1 Tax=Galleria mellonella TaxID=7137 RepID=A0ABM3N3K7_GALME|nr:uncharacterized protein LOC113510319 [Galleria mellonella]
MSLDVNISEPDEFNCIELHGVLNDVAKLKSIDDFRYHVDLISGKGESYVANTFRVTITDVGNEGNVVNVIVKTLVNTERQILFHKLHEREVAVYKHIVPVFNKIHDNKNNKLGNKIVLPECLLSCAETKKEVIILEDLIEDGWSPDVRQSLHEELDYTKVHTVMTALANFHALSFIFEKFYPEEFVEVKSQFQDLLYDDNFLSKTKLVNYMFDSYDSSLKLVNDVEAKEKLSVIKPKILDILRAYTKPGKYNVLCHGDCWINNMLFKHRRDKSTRVCFIDFQAVRYASPVTDIIYFLYLCTNSRFRSEHFVKLKSEYYDTLKSTLTLYELDVNSLYPIEDFEKEINDAMQYGLIIAMVELKVVNTLLEDEVMVEEGDILPETTVHEMLDETDLLQTKINDVVQEAVKNGVLDKLLNKITK